MSEINDRSRVVWDADADWQKVFQRLRASPWQVALVFSGGGTGAIARCFRREGASINFVEAVVPYSRPALAAYLGGRPSEGSASVDTAGRLSRKAQSRAEELSERKTTHRFAGLSLVAALPTNPPRKGLDRIHVGLSFEDQSVVRSAALDQGRFDRAAAESIAEMMVCDTLAKLVGIETPNRQIPGVAWATLA